MVWFWFFALLCYVRCMVLKRRKVAIGNLVRMCNDPVFCLFEFQNERNPRCSFDRF